ncbi:DUSP7, partial [Symbiodinium pilosum]
VLSNFTFDVHWSKEHEVTVQQPAALLPWLHIGAMSDTWRWLQGELEELNIAAAIVLCKNHLDKSSIEEAKKLAEGKAARLVIVDAFDHPSYPIVRKDPGGPLEVALELVSWVRQRKQKLLINCWAGMNRAAAISAAVMMEVENLTLLEACEVLAAKRGRVLHNVSFRKQLLSLAVSLGLAGDLNAAASSPARPEGTDQADGEKAKPVAAADDQDGEPFRKDDVDPTP